MLVFLQAPPQILCAAKYLDRYSFMHLCNLATQILSVLDTSLSCTGNRIHQISVDLEDDFKTATDIPDFLYYYPP